MVQARPGFQVAAASVLETVLSQETNHVSAPATSARLRVQPPHAEMEALSAPLPPLTAACHGMANAAQPRPRGRDMEMASVNTNITHSPR